MNQPQLAVRDDPVASACEQMLAPAGLDMRALQRAMDALMARDLDYADLYFQHTRYETWSVEDGIVREGW